MSDNSLIPIQSQVVAVAREHTEDVADEVRPANPLVLMQTLLYGRYAYAICLGLILGIGGAVAAWVLTPAKYEIVGYVRVKPYVPKVLYQSDENGMLPSFDTFVDLQESLLQSQRVLNKAGENPEWLALHRKTATPDASGISTDGLVVDHAKGSELITVTATDRDLNAATTAVKAILTAYLDISGETEGAGDAHRLQVLEDLRTSLANQVAGIHDRIFAIANEYGTEDLAQQHEMKVEEANRLDSELQEIDLSLSMAQSSPDVMPTTAPAAATRSVPLSRDEVAQMDPQMRDYIAEETRLTLQLDRLKARLGENNVDIKSAQSELNSVESRINENLAEHQKRADAGTGYSGVDRDRSKLPPAELRAQRANIRTLYEKTQADALDLGRKDLQLRNFKEEEAVLKQRLKDASDRIDQLNLEASMSGRISILSYGEVPTTPPKSKRTAATAAAGVGGFGFGVGLVMLWGFVDRRVRSVLHMVQLESTVRMLGVLPVLPDHSEDPEQTSMAAFCIHQIRNLLDSGLPGKSRVLAVTSPAPGDGKTSLTLALGLSFSNAGSRTLMIDCDMVGGGLSARLHDAIQAEIGSANSSAGLLNALDGQPLPKCISQVLSKNLYVLPLGEAAAHLTHQLSPREFRAVLSQARASFDVVIVDTGPILGSLEAAIVVREVDEVVLAIARNSRSTPIKHAIKRLQTLQVRFAGLVFNRANPADVAFSHYGSSSVRVDALNICYSYRSFRQRSW